MIFIILFNEFYLTKMDNTEVIKKNNKSNCKNIISCFLASPSLRQLIIIGNSKCGKTFFFLTIAE